MSGSSTESIVFEAGYSDGISGPAANSAAALNKVAAAAQNAETATAQATAAASAQSDVVSSKLGPSLSSLNKTLDESVAYHSAVTAAETKRAASLSTLNNAVATGQTITLGYDQAVARVNATYAASVASADALRAKKAALFATMASGVTTAASETDAVSKGAKAAAEAAVAAGGLSAAHEGLNRELFVVGETFHKLTDQITAGGSAIKAASFEVPKMVGELGGLGQASALVGSLLTGPVGLAAGALAVVGGLAAMGVEAEREQSRLAVLTTQLQATRTDASAMAAEITTAGRAISALPGWNRTDATTAATAIGSTYDFSGGSADIKTLAVDAKDLATVLGTNLKTGLDNVKLALVDPSAEIDALAKVHFPGISQSLVDLVKKAQAAGDQGTAFGLVMDAIHAKTVDATTHALTPFQQALEDFTKAATPVVAAVGSLSVSIGTGLLNATTSVLNLLEHPDLRTPGFTSGAQAISAKMAGQPIYPDLTQYGAPGLNTNPTSGAAGLFQITPANAQIFARQGIDITSPEGNALAGATLLANNLARTGSVNSALASYGGFVTKDPSGYQASVARNSDVSLLPSDSVGAVLNASSLTGVPANLLAGVAMTESSGHQYAGMVSNSAALSTNAQTAGSGYSAYSDQAAAISANIKAMTAYQATLKTGSDEWVTYQEKINVATGALRDAISPQQKLTQSTTDSLAPLNSAAGFQRSMSEEVNKFTIAAKQSADGVVDQTALTADLSAKQKELSTAYSDGTVAVQKQAVAASTIAGVYSQGGAAIAHATNYAQAYTEAQNDFAVGSPAFAQAVQARTAALDSLSRAQAAQQIASATASNDNQVQVLQLETSSLGENNQARSQAIALLQAEQELKAKGIAVTSAEGQAYIASTLAVSNATAAYQHQQQVVQDVQTEFSNLATTIGDDISNAFTSGAGAGVTFGNVLKAIETQMISLIVRLGVINPLLNNLFGSTNTTLGDAAGLLGSVAGGGGSTTTSGGSGGILGTLGSVGSLASRASGGGLLSSLGLGGVGSSISSLLSTPIISGSGSVSLAGINAAAIGNESAATASTVSLGSLLGGAGAGFAAGGLLNSLVGGSSAGGTVGSGLGSAAGAAIGSIIPGVGTLIGGLIGGAGGGLLGGLFGGHKENPYSNVSVYTNKAGQFTVGQSTSQVTDNSQQVAQVTQEVNALNQFLSSTGIKAVSRNTQNANIANIGAGISNLNQVGDFDGTTNRARYTSSDPVVNQALSQGLNASNDNTIAKLESTITTLKQMATTVESLGVTVKTFSADGTVVVKAFTGYTGETAQALASLDGKKFDIAGLQQQIQAIVTLTQTTIPNLLAQTTTPESQFRQSIDQINISFNAAETAAQSYGLSIDDLTAKQKQLEDSMFDAQLASLRSADTSVSARYDAATGNQEGADLINFDASAAQQRTALAQSWSDVFGSGYAAMQEYQNESVNLDKTLSAERLQIQAQYNQQAIAAQQQAAAAQQAAIDQATGSAASAISSLSAYASGLSTSSSSPLSTADQYSSAQQAFYKASQLASEGDPTGFSSLQNAAQTFLGISQTYNSGGSGYTADFRTVQQALSSVSMIGSDTLTATFYAQQTQTQTASLVDQLQQLRQAVATLGDKLRVQNLKAA